jgi:hypothetical protein
LVDAHGLSQTLHLVRRLFDCRCGCSSSGSGSSDNALRRGLKHPSQLSRFGCVLGVGVLPALAAGEQSIGNNISLSVSNKVRTVKCAAVSSGIAALAFLAADGEHIYHRNKNHVCANANQPRPSTCPNSFPFTSLMLLVWMLAVLPHFQCPFPPLPPWLSPSYSQ